MKKYNLDFKSIREVDGSSYYLVDVKEKIEQSVHIGDQIGLYEDGNVLEFTDMIDLEDEEIRDFLRDNLEDHVAVRGLIRRVI